MTAARAALVVVHDGEEFFDRSLPHPRSRGQRGAWPTVDEEQDWVAAIGPAEVHDLRDSI